MVIGTCNLAPLSLPTTVIVAYNAVLAPNNVLTVVALRLIVVPITVADTLVPNVVVELTFKASDYSIGTYQYKCNNHSDMQGYIIVS